MKPFVYRQIIAMALMGSVTTFSPSVRAEFFAPADSPESEYLSTRLEIDLADLDMSDWDLKSANQLFFDQVSNALYGGQGVPQADDKAEARVVVKLSWVDAGAAHYAVKVTVMRDDAPPATTEFECEGCGDSEVGQAIEAHLEEIVPYLERKTDSETYAEALGPVGQDWDRGRSLGIVGSGGRCSHLHARAATRQSAGSVPASGRSELSTAWRRRDVGRGCDVRNGSGVVRA